MRSQLLQYEVFNRPDGRHYDGARNVVGGKRLIKDSEKRIIKRPDANVIGPGVSVFGSNGFLGKVADDQRHYMCQEVDRLGRHFVEKVCSVPKGSINEHQNAAEGDYKMIVQSREALLLRARGRDPGLSSGCCEFRGRQLAVGGADDRLA